MDRIIPITPIVDGIVQKDERYLRLSTVQDIRFTTVKAQLSEKKDSSTIQAVAMLTQQGVICAQYPFQIAIAWATLFDNSRIAEFETLRQIKLIEIIRNFFICGLSCNPELLEQDGQYYGCYDGCTTTAEYRRRSPANQQVATYHISMDSSHIGSPLVRVMMV